MKSKEIIEANLQQKIALFLAGYGKEEHILDHIILLDWVLSDKATIRTINEIIKERGD